MPAVLKNKRETLTEQIVLRVTEEEMARAVELAEEHDVSIARVFRVAYQQMVERMDSEPPSPSKKKRSKK